MTRLFWTSAAVAIAALILGCGESKETGAAFVANQAAQQRKLHRLRRQLRARRAEIMQQQRAERAASRLMAEFEPTAASSSPRGAATPSATRRGFTVLEGRLPGTVGATIGPPGRAAALRVGRLSSGSAWSTIKVPITLAVLDDAGGPGGLQRSQAADIRAALTLSDNNAAAALFAGLERRHGGSGGAAAVVTSMLRRAGDSTTRVSTRGRDGFSPYGQTEWPLALQHLFMSRLAGDCLAPSRSGRYVLRLMGEVSSDVWGLGSTALPARWKGGWGPGTDGRYLVRQMGVLEVGSRRAVVTLAAIPDDGSFETAQSMATAVSRWLAAKAPRFARAASC